MSDKLGPIEIEFLLDKKADEQAKNLKASYDAIGIAGKKSSQQIKDAIKEQKEYIKGLIREIKDLEANFENVIAGKGKRDLGNDIVQAKRRLKEADRELLAMQEQLINANSVEEASQNKLVGTLGKWLTGLLTIGIAMKGFKAIMESTEKTSLLFHSTLEGLKTAFDYFMKSIAEADFSNLIKGIKDAFRAGRDYKKEQEKIDNIRREYAIKEADLNKEIEEQRRIFYEDDRTSNTNKLKAADQMLKLMEQKAKLEIDLALRSYNAVADLEKKKNKMSEEDIRYAIENYQRVEEIGGLYNKLNKYVETYNKNVKLGLANNPEGSTYIDPFNTGAIKVNKADIERFKREMEQIAPDAAKMGQILDGLNRMNAKERQIIADSIIEIKQAENQFLVESKRVFRMKENLADQDIENARNIDKEIKILKIESANIGLKDKQRELNKELDLAKLNYEEELKLFKDNEEAKLLLFERYTLERLNILKKYNTEVADAANELNVGKGYSILNKALINAGITPATGGEAGPTGTMNKLRPFGGTPGLSELQKDKKRLKDTETSLKNQKELRLQILESAIHYTSELVSQLGLSQESADALNSMLSTVMQLASGNFYASAFGILSKILGTILTMRDLPNEPSWKKQIEAWDELIKRQERLIDLSERTGGTEAALRGEIVLYQKEIDELEKYVAEQRARRGTNAELQEALDLLEQYRIDIADAQQELDDYLSGGITQNIVADAISQGFIEGGKNGIDNIAAYMNDVLKTAAIKIFEGKILDSPQMKAYREYITESLSDAVLTDEEKARIMQMGQDLSTALKPVWEGLTGALDFGEESADALKGAIKGISAEQASVLAGQTNAIRIAQANANNILQSSLSQLMTISANTEYLKSIDHKLDALKSNSFRAQGVI